jgi:hypothetical protein
MDIEKNSQSDSPTEVKNKINNNNTSDDNVVKTQSKTYTYINTIKWRDVTYQNINNVIFLKKPYVILLITLLYYSIIASL